MNCSTCIYGLEAMVHLRYIGAYFDLIASMHLIHNALDHQI